MHFAPLQWVKARGMLARKLVAVILLTSAVFSTIAAAVQLSFYYRQDRNEVLSSFAVVETSFRQGLENALWEFNFDQVEVLLDGIFVKSDIAFVGLVASTGEAWERGTADAPNTILRELFLTYSSGNDTVAETVGTLQIRLSLEGVRSRLWSQFFALLLTNFGRTIVVSFVILAVFDRLVTQHLKRIASHVADPDWMEQGKSLVLKRKADAEKDELDSIFDAINSAQTASRDAFSKIEAEVQERRRSEARLADKTSELERTNRRLQASNQEQAEFTYAISHDLKSPTNTINMILSELIEYHPDELGEDAVQLLLNANSTIDRMGRIIEDVLEYSMMIGANDSFEPVDLDELLEEIVKDSKGDIVASGGTVSYADLPAINGVRSQLRMLFQNLVSNALKFSRPGVPPMVSISAAGNSENDLQQIVVADNGIGIDPKHTEQIFNLFQRLHNYEEYPGTGLGLTLCRRIITNHAGQIEVESTPGAGTRIRLRLPAAP